MLSFLTDFNVAFINIISEVPYASLSWRVMTAVAKLLSEIIRKRILGPFSVFIPAVQSVIEFSIPFTSAYNSALIPALHLVIWDLFSVISAPVNFNPLEEQ